MSDTELAVIPKETALTVFSAEKGLDPYLAKIRAEIDAFLPRADMTTPGGRKAIASFAYDVARSKTYLDETGKQLVAELKQIPAKIDAERKRMRETLDQWKDEVRAPLTQWEEAEKARVAGHEQRLAGMQFYATGWEGEGSGALSVRLRTVEGYVIDDSWQEFKIKATQAKAEAVRILTVAHTAAVKSEADAAELQRLRDEAAARLRREQEERIAKEAADKARREAEERAAAAAAEVEREAKAAREQAEREAKERQEATERKAKADADSAAKREADLKRQREQAEKQAKEAEERATLAEQQARLKALRDLEAAVEAERVETARREANKTHKAKINRAALAALMDGGMTEASAKLAITLIAEKKIPAVTITY